MELSLYVLVIVSYLSSAVLSARILLLSSLETKSHVIFYRSIAEAIANRGHHVTFVSPFKQSGDFPNIRDVLIKNFSVGCIMSSKLTAFEDPAQTIWNLIFESPRLCSETLAEKEVQELKNEKFDLLMNSLFISDCYLSFVHHFKVPYVYILPLELSGPFSDMMSSIEFYSLVPNKLMEAQFPLSFKDRLVSVLLNTVLVTAFNLHTTPAMDRICRERGLCPPDMPSLQEIRDNASLAIINAVRSLEYPPRPMLPNIIYAGGAHIKPAKELPKELEDWVKTSGEDGFIYFSTGSALRPSDLPEKARKILINVFGSLKQKVLWKWDEDSMQDLPKNVKLSKWLPQQDVLGHQKLKLFITHGGLLSTQEATYNGVPIIGMPVFVDQFSNMQGAVNEGWAKVMHWKDLQEDLFRNLILTTLADESLREVSQRRSALIKDVPIPPGEEAAYWIEYVIRHNGADHLKSPIRKMRWYEIYNLDVWCFTCCVISVSFYTLLLLLRFIVKTCWMKLRNNKKKEKKN